MSKDRKDWSTSFDKTWTLHNQNSAGYMAHCTICRERGEHLGVIDVRGILIFFPGFSLTNFTGAHP